MKRTTESKSPLKFPAIFARIIDLRSKKTDAAESTLPIPLGSVTKELPNEPIDSNEIANDTKEAIASQSQGLPPNKKFSPDEFIDLFRNRMTSEEQDTVCHAIGNDPDTLIGAMFQRALLTMEFFKPKLKAFNHKGKQRAKESSLKHMAAVYCLKEEGMRLDKIPGRIETDFSHWVQDPSVMITETEPKKIRTKVSKIASKVKKMIEKPSEKNSQVRQYVQHVKSLLSTVAEST